MKKLTLFFALALSTFAQDALPSRVAFLGTGWTARQGAPTTGFGGVALKLTDRVGGIYSWNSVVATSQTNSFASGLAKPVGSIGPFTGWVVSQVGVAAGNGTAALTYGGGGMVTMPLKLLFYLPTRVLGQTAWVDNIKGTFFFGAQINQINSAVGMPLAGVNVSPGGGLAFAWGQ